MVMMVLVMLMVMMMMLECRGTETGFSHTHADSRRRYADYQAVYTNCTHVQNNLEIVYLDDDDDYDLSFLSNIREVRTATEVINCLSIPRQSYTLSLLLRHSVCNTIYSTET